MTRFVCSLLLSLMFAVTNVAVADDVFYMERFLPGEHYQLVKDPLKVAGEKIEVREFFWYGCPHCYDFEPKLNPWKKALADDVKFVRSHSWWRKNMKLHAQMFYTAEKLNMLHILHDKMFEAIHEKKNPLATKDAIMVLFANSGVHKDKFTQAFNSHEVMLKVDEVNTMQRQVKVAGVPTLLIHGKYLVKGSHDVKASDMLEIADFLISKERIAKSKKKK